MNCIVSDLDGTLILNDNTMSTCTRSMMKTLIDKDVCFLVCTGKSYIDFRSAFPLDIRTPAILLNGALFVDAQGNEVFSFPMQREQIKQIEHCLLQQHLPCLYFTSTGIYGSGDLSVMMECVKAYDSPTYQGDYFMEPVQIVDGYEQIAQPILKMESMCVNIGTIEAMKQQMHIMKEIQVSSSLSYNIELSACNVNKAFMLHKVLSHYHLSKEDALYFGDSNNDLEVFEEFPFCVAVGNAEDEIKALAYDICGCCDEDGVAKYLKEKVSQIA